MICESEFLKLWILLVRNLLPGVYSLMFSGSWCYAFVLQIIWCWHCQLKKGNNDEIKWEIPKQILISSQEGKMCSSNICRVTRKLLMLFNYDRKPQKLWSLPCPDICRIIWFFSSNGKLWGYYEQQM